MSISKTHDWRTDTSTIALRSHLEANNGIKRLDILGVKDVAKAIELFNRDGFVVVADVLEGEQIDFLRQGCNQVAAEILELDEDRKGNRGNHRYSFGGSSLTRGQLHRPEWKMLLEVKAVTDLVGAIFGSPDFVLRGASGDF